jgi:presenilin-like A22 family membrane protease
MMTNKAGAGRDNVGHVGHVVIIFWARGRSPGRPGIPLNVGHVAFFFLFDYMTDKMKLFF